MEDTVQELQELLLLNLCVSADYEQFHHGQAVHNYYKQSINWTPGLFNVLLPVLVRQRLEEADDIAHLLIA